MRAALVALVIAAAASSSGADAPTKASVNDFDFLVGDWTVQHRRLKHRHVGSDDWDRFVATAHAERRLGGVVNVEEQVSATTGFSGLSLATLDLARQQWSMYWITGKQGVLQPPTLGRFEAGVGTFYGDDVDDGVPVKARYRWSAITPRSVQWDQAFSWDGGKTWETNWVMEFARVPPRSPR